MLLQDKYQGTFKKRNVNLSTSTVCNAQEMLHHCGATADYHRLASRLSRERLACAWPYVATRARSEVGADGSLTLLSATPATIACLSALLPETPATTIVLSGADLVFPLSYLLLVPKLCQPASCEPSKSSRQQGYLSSAAS